MRVRSTAAREVSWALARTGLDNPRSYPEDRQLSSPMTSRIPESYRRRVGVAYLRQSSLAQLRDHSGSTALQRDLSLVLKDLGFDQTEILDGDLGVSGATPGARSGFN